MLLDCVNLPDWARRWAMAVPQCKLIIAHLGSPLDEFMVDQFIAICRDNPNVWLDSSYSHVPWKMPAKVRSFEFTDEQLQLILCENISGLLGGL